MSSIFQFKHSAFYMTVYLTVGQCQHSGGKTAVRKRFLMDFSEIGYSLHLYGLYMII